MTGVASADQADQATQARPRFKTIVKADGRRTGVQEVYDGEQLIGHVWREEVHVLVSKLTQPRRMQLKLRWFARCVQDTQTLGQGTRAAMLMGAGFTSRDAAVKAMRDAQHTKSAPLAQGG